MHANEIALASVYLFKLSSSASIAFSWAIPSLFAEDHCLSEVRHWRLCLHATPLCE